MPPQHGAWAFVGLPVVLGWIAGGVSWLTFLLGVGFVVAFPASYFVTAFLRYPRPQRFRKGLLVWVGCGLPIAVLAILLQPWLVWLIPAYGVAFAINLAFAKAHNERSLVNDAVFIVECVAVVPVLWAASVGATTTHPPDPSQAPAAVWALSAYAAMTLIGSTMHVRSLIRERSNNRFRTLSRAWSVGSLAIGIAIAWDYSAAAAASAVVAFGYLAARTFLVGRVPLKPGVIGAFELVGFLLVAVAASILDRS